MRTTSQELSVVQTGMWLRFSICPRRVNPDATRGCKKEACSWEKTTVKWCSVHNPVTLLSENPSRKVVAVENETRWLVVELLGSWLSLPQCKALMQAEFASYRTSVATITWSFTCHWNLSAELCFAHWLTSSKLQPSQPAFPSWITCPISDKSQWTPFLCKGEPLKFILVCITEIPTECSSRKA